MDIDIDLIEPDSRAKSVLEIKLLPQEIAEARAKGIVRPVVVRPVKNAAGRAQRYIIVATTRSWLLAQAIGLSKVPVYVRNDDSPAIDDPGVETVRPLQWAENARSEIRLVQRGKRRNRGITRYARKMGVAPGTAKNRMRLLSLAKPVQRLLDEDRVCEGAAKALASLPVDAQVRLVRQIVKQKLKVRKVEELVRIERNHGALSAVQKPAIFQVKNAISIGSASMPPVAKDPDTARLEMLVSEACGAKVSIENGSLTIFCAEDTDVLTGIMQKLKLPGTGCRAVIEGPRLIVDYANDLERLDVLLRNIGVTDF